ncbi:ABC transporter permease [Oceanidesulfovibrio indonesiensis]|uniref:ABC transporter permease n=1 Tax=Oceanidesulfovibrio indonesiensis TaxID=54767 RepID=A0A7M3MGZ6_9BACT|nr:ABC transporter permease [Oceanidesulfovibrio indonesiensis]TVM18756.1 ABC transporter permease [Oceanidesulfovibrio indonesiensis]
MFGDAAFILQISLKSSVAVLLAALGETLVQRSGVLNLGLEGMMLMGALTGFAVGYVTGNPWLAVSASCLVGGAMALIHAFFCITLRANQVLSGLALTMLGMGLSNFLGRGLIGRSGIRLSQMPIPGLSDIPVLGKALFTQSIFAYVAIVLTVLLALFLARTRRGLMVRAVGEDAAAADTAGINVVAVRYLCTMAGGMLAGMGGAYLSLVYTPGWKEGMTAGQGWIAIAMVVFATWKPPRVLVGALLFGLLTSLQFYFQVTGVELIPVYVLRMLPYLLTIAVLVLVNRVLMRRGADGASGPADLGVPFFRG